MAISFQSLKDNYPTQNRTNLFNSLGGDWPSLIPNITNYGNTCAIRLSIALRGAGQTIGSSYKEAMDGDGNPIVLKVATMEKLITSLFGAWTWGMSKNPGADISGDLPDYQGIIAYHADWKDATGHFDLWDKDKFIGSGSLADIKDGFDIAIWKF